MTATIHKFPQRKLTVVEKRKLVADGLDFIASLRPAEYDRLRKDIKDLDNWEREIAAIVPRDYKEE